MSEPIPESIPTSADPRSKRPTKRRALTPSSQHANQVDALFANPDKEIVISANKPRSNLPPPPEIVPNVQGSSAGAGSGEFHVYKASRRREYERLRAMDEEVKEQKEQKEFEAEREERKKKDEAKTSKNRARRDKAKERKKNTAKVAQTNGIVMAEQVAGKERPSLKPNPRLPGRVDEETVDEESETKHEEQGLIIHDDD